MPSIELTGIAGDNCCCIYPKSMADLGFSDGSGWGGRMPISDKGDKLRLLIRGDLQHGCFYFLAKTYVKTPLQIKMGAQLKLLLCKIYLHVW